MKLASDITYKRYIDRIYIPHGSDETYTYVIPCLTHNYIYIPHGSDET